MNYYESHDRFPVSVDCIVFSLRDGALSVLLAPRKFEPCEGSLSLMGGFVRRAESVDSAAARVLHELTGLDDVYMEQVGAFGAPDRDPGDRVISVAYFALLRSDAAIEERLKARGATWLPLERTHGLSFDHPLMIERALALLRRRIMVEPRAFDLLPELFTMARAQALYEMILGEPLDKRNFRRRLLENDCIVQTEMIDKLSSKRGAALFRLDSGIYDKTKKFKF